MGQTGLNLIKPLGTYLGALLIHVNIVRCLNKGLNVLQDWAQMIFCLFHGKPKELYGLETNTSSRIEYP